MFFFKSHDLRWVRQQSYDDKCHSRSITFCVEKLLHFGSILLQFATIVTTFCGVTGIFTRANVKLAAKWYIPGGGGRGGEIVSPVSFWVNNYIKRKLTTFFKTPSTQLEPMKPCKKYRTNGHSRLPYFKR